MENPLAWIAEILADISLPIECDLCRWDRHVLRRWGWIVFDVRACGWV